MNPNRALSVVSDFGDMDVEGRGWLKGITDVVALEVSVRYAGPLASRACDRPPCAGSHEFHLASLPPPSIDIARQSEPRAAFGAKARQVT